MSKKITKPRQSGSPRSLDRWQREVLFALKRLGEARRQLARHYVHLHRLLASMQKAERR